MRSTLHWPPRTAVGLDVDVADIIGGTLTEIEGIELKALAADAVELD